MKLLTIAVGQWMCDRRIELHAVKYFIATQRLVVIIIFSYRFCKILPIYYLSSRI